MLITVNDVTAHCITSQWLAHYATHDELTGLPNRAHVVARLTAHLGPDPSDSLAAVLFIDLDRFKTINDSLGHHTGDLALRTTAQRLRAALRPSDFIGRYGGDEFVALLTGPTSPAQVEIIAERLYAAVAQPQHVEGATLMIQASIGIVSTDRDSGRDAHQVLRDADTSMYAAKHTRGPTARARSAGLKVDSDDGVGARWSV